MSDEEEAVRYDLVRRVPQMAQWCSIQTNYGPIEIREGDDPKGLIQAAVKKILQQRLRQLDRAAPRDANGQRLDAKVIDSASTTTQGVRA